MMPAMKIANPTIDRPLPAKLPVRWDCWVISLLLLVLNGPVLAGTSPEHFMFLPGALGAGEWWRVFTHPFVHVSWYHFLLDGAAFVVLYASLRERSWMGRLLYVAFGAAGSLALAWAMTDLEKGLCGLSGVAHGLMAVSALEMVDGSAAGSAERRIGWTSFAIVIAKAAYEVITGRMFLEFLHFGLLGSPVAVSHAGGILGALLLWLAMSTSRQSRGIGKIPLPIRLFFLLSGRGVGQARLRLASPREVVTINYASAKAAAEIGGLCREL
jgi:rhomboid family GlyGly-CTERM serine protease